MAAFVVPLDVQPVSGDEATALQEMIVDGVRQRLARQGAADVDGEMASFLRSTKQYGAKEGALSAAEYWHVLTSLFGDEKARAASFCAAAI